MRHHYLLLVALVATSICGTAASDSDEEGAGAVSVSKPFLMDSTVADMKWLKGGDGNAKVVLVRSSHGNVYRSDDDGKTWKSLEDTLTQKGSVPMWQAKIQKLIVSPANDQHVILKGFGKTNLFSTDGGASFTAILGNTFVQIIPHPTEEGWLLGSAYTGKYPNRKLGLYYSKDFGNEWKQIATHLRQFAWGASFGGSVSTIVASIHDGGTDSSGKMGEDFDPKISTFWSDDFFATRTKVVPHGNKLIPKGKFLFVAAVNPEEVTDVRLMVSEDGGRRFRKCRFPFHITERGYSIVDASEGEAFVQVEHEDEDLPFSSLYMSGQHGSSYSLSLRRVVRDFRNLADFEAVGGVEGVYVANVADKDITEEDIEPGKGVPRRSVITFDKGAKWQPITAPEKDSRGKKNRCKDCSLHIHGKTSFSFGPVYSSPSAVGLILAAGTVGHHVHDRAGDTNVFISRDAGLTWTEIAKGSHIYEFGDHGGLIVMADNQKPTKKLKYSWNEGQDWTEYQFWDHSIDVDNVITEPTGTGSTFMVYGRRHGKGIILHVDFSTLHERKCIGADAADSEESDYEVYSPSQDLRDGGCLMGAKVDVIRRKAHKACFNGQEFERSTIEHQCECQESDYECDYGFTRTDSGECERDLDTPPVGYGPPKDCSGTYEVTRGYRLVANNRCVRGVNHRPVVLRCPGFTVGGLVTLLLLLAVGGGITMFMAYRKQHGSNPESFGDVLKMFPMKASFSGSGSAGAYTALRSGPDTMDDDLGFGDDDDEEAQVLGDHAIDEFTGDNSSKGRESNTITPALAPPPSSSAKAKLDDTEFE